MKNETKKATVTGPDKHTPQTVSGKNEAQTKQRTEPLKEDEVRPKEQQEGDMSNRKKSH